MAACRSPPPSPCFEGPLADWARGLGHKPDAVAPVGSADTCSWQYHRPAGVAFSFQVSPHLVECQADEATNVFNHDHAGP